MFSNLGSEHDGGDLQHGQAVGGALSSAGGDAPARLEAADQTLDLVDPGAGQPIDQCTGVLALGLWDDAADAAPVQVMPGVPVR